MKRLINKIDILLFALLLLMANSCTDLNEQLYGSLSPDNYYKNEDEALSSLAGVYRGLGTVADGGNTFRIINLGTDEFIITARNDGRWYDGGVYIEFANHTWTSQNNRIASGWDNIFNIIGTANSVIESLQNSSQEDLDEEIAEARALRAIAYFYAMDLWGNVPYVTDARIDQNNLPSNTPRDEVFSKVETELNEVASILPSINEVNRTKYYPRITKEAVWSVLAIMYLNAEVYTGQARWQDALDMAQKVIDSNGYILEPDFLTNFAPDNDKSQELILSVSVDPSQNAGGNTFLQKTLHDNLKFKYNLPFTPQNGFSTFKIAYDRYQDDNDVRKQLILNGPQVDENGDPIPSIEDPNEQLVLIPHQDNTNAHQNEGFRPVKYQPDPNWVGSSGHNDYPIIRYAEILLIKAEALIRLNGDKQQALNLVNQVRNRSNANNLKLADFDVQDVIDERARELLWEGSRRRDMIRTGEWFNGNWKFKTTKTPEFRKILPIPTDELDANPNLQQNPGY